MITNYKRKKRELYNFDRWLAEQILKFLPSQIKQLVNIITNDIQKISCNAVQPSQPIKKHCPEVNWNIVDSLTCNITGYHLRMGHYSFDYDKKKKKKKRYHINAAHEKHARQIVCMLKFNWLVIIKQIKWKIERLPQCFKSTSVSVNV
ncbi:hypothetical protein T01_5334 [Trichinella spiralis]|uniref:Uncharacterized protein n=1 Tax=Trichinella spiralis TaxID=6334 RepID=A0A0V1BNC2_TRISP|nr:hypothetical protein T01_5334 [Trichinella spiralis]